MAGFGRMRSFLVDQHERTNHHSVAILDVQRCTDKVHGLLAKQIVYVHELLEYRDSARQEGVVPGNNLGDFIIRGHRTLEATTRTS